MRWTVYQTLAMALLSQALIIPSDITADGVYQVVARDDGSEVHTKIADVPDLSNITLTQNSALDVAAQSSSQEVDNVLNGRSNGQNWCGCGYNMNTGDCDAAVADLKHQFGSINKVGPYLSFYSIRGGVVAFVCNTYSGSSFYTSGDTLGREFAAITNACGRYIAGSRDMGTSAPTIVGYMRYRNGLDFCRDSTSSPSNHC
jgi:hypothetical protein